MARTWGGWHAWRDDACQAHQHLGLVLSSLRMRQHDNGRIFKLTPTDTPRFTAPGLPTAGIYSSTSRGGRALTLVNSATAKLGRLAVITLFCRMRRDRITSTTVPIVVLQCGPHEWTTNRWNKQNIEVKNKWQLARRSFAAICGAAYDTMQRPNAIVTWSSVTHVKVAHNKIVKSLKRGRKTQVIDD